MIIHFEKNGDQFEGEIDEDVYYSKLFPIFRDHLIPTNQKKFYTLEQVIKKDKIKKLTKPQTRIFGWEMIFGLMMFGILGGIIIGVNLK